MATTTQNLEKAEARRPYPPTASLEKTGDSSKHIRHQDSASNDDQGGRATPPPPYEAHYRFQESEEDAQNVDPGRCRHHQSSLPGPLPACGKPDDSRNNLKQNLKNDLKHNLKQLKHDLKQSKHASKNDLKQFKHELKNDLKQFKHDLEHDLKQLKHDSKRDMKQNWKRRDHHGQQAQAATEATQAKAPDVVTREHGGRSKA